MSWNGVGGLKKKVLGETGKTKSFLFDPRVKIEMFLVLFSKEMFGVKKREPKKKIWFL